MDKIVYVVHCIDTEGPLYESIEATFERIKDFFNLPLEISEETLKKLQNKEIDLDGKEEVVYNLVAPKRINTNDSWEKIDKMLDKITSSQFRKKYCDSFGGGWIFNWFCIDHVGFNENNPRKRDIGHHKIFDHYEPYLKDNDSIQWHYHPLAIINDAHRSGTTYLNSSNIFDILTRKVIDRMWFPAVSRPGFDVERPDFHWFLEQWIPFDYANLATKDEKTDDPEQSQGRLGDWRRAPKSWIPYNPDHNDYQKKGNCNRFIARCLNMEARDKELTTNDVRDAFKEAQTKGKSLLSFINHDFRDMAPEIDKVWNMIKKVEKEFEDVKFKFVDTVQGMREVLNLTNIKPPKFKIDLKKLENKTILSVESENDIFGVQPFLAIKTKSQQYFWENFNFQGKNKWSYTFDFNNVEIDKIEKIGIAANTKAGVTEIILVDADTREIKRRVLNE